MVNTINTKQFTCWLAYYEVLAFRAETGSALGEVGAMAGGKVDSLNINIKYDTL